MDMPMVLSTCIHTDELSMTRKNTKNDTYPLHQQTVNKILSMILADKEIFGQTEALQETHEYKYSKIELGVFKLVP
jgi:hypothetical protein